MNSPCTPRTIRASRGAVLLVAFALLQSALPADEKSEGLNASPTTTMGALRGLSQTSSAETMGMGRLSISLVGTWYQQSDSFSNANLPNKGANIVMGRGAFSFGVNPYVDLFASLAGLGTEQYTSAGDRSGIGSLCAGVQGGLPFPATAHFNLAGQLAVIGGTSANQIDFLAADGYDYFELRDGYDFMGKVLESFVFGSEAQSFKVHLNEGIVTSLQADKDNLLLLAFAIQANVHSAVALGLELNARTYLGDPNFSTDPLWVTPSIQFRTPYGLNFELGGDVSLSRSRGDGLAEALEPYRLFGGIAFTYDLLAKKRAEETEKRNKEAVEKAVLEERTKVLSSKADSLGRKAHDDSLAMAQQMEQQRVADKRRADSLALEMARKAQQDSIALADARQKLEVEKSKRSDAEKQLLSTGLLLLDAVYFESGRTEISINSKPYLNIIGKMLTKYPKLMLEVSGHTDNVGSDASNYVLSQARAESVRDYLTEIAPELGARLTAHGYGFTRPKASNNTADGRKINRRVELQVLNRDVLKEYNQ